MTPSKRFGVVRVLSVMVLAWLLLVFSVSAIAAPKAKSIDFWQRGDANSQIRVDHSAWQSLLNRYLDDAHSSGVNRFAYAAVSAGDRAKLVDYLAYLQSLAPTAMNAHEQLAYWINLYNAQTVYVIIEAMDDDEITSIKQVRSSFFRAGPWSKKSLLIQQQEVSLDDIEHGILRPNWRDHRLHFALNCASIGCPNLQKKAFTASNANELMAQAEQEFLQHPRAIKRRDNVLVLSKLFTWYRDDFAKNTEALLAYLATFSSEAVVEGPLAELRIEYEYDWDLNSPK